MILGQGVWLVAAGVAGFASAAGGGAQARVAFGVSAGSLIRILTHEQLEISYDVLATRGNVGTPSIFYVLSETTKRRRPGRGDRGLMVTVSPGVTVGLMLLVF